MACPPGPTITGSPLGPTTASPSCPSTTGKLPLCSNARIASKSSGRISPPAAAAAAAAAEEPGASVGGYRPGGMNGKGGAELLLLGPPPAAAALLSPPPLLLRLAMALHCSFCRSSCCCARPCMLARGEREAGVRASKAFVRERKTEEGGGGTGEQEQPCAAHKQDSTSSTASSPRLHPKLSSIYSPAAPLVPVCCWAPVPAPA